MATSCTIGEIIRQIEKKARGIEGLRVVFLQPEQLRCFHFWRNAATYIFQNGMGCRVDAFGLFAGTMIHPDDDISFRFSCRARGQWIALFVENNQRTGGIKANAFDGFRGNFCLLQRCRH